MSDTQPNRPIEPQPTNRWQWLSIFDKTFRDLWFYVAAVSLVVNMVLAFRPQPIIQSGAALVDSNPLTSLFSLTNNGILTIYNIKIQCDVWDGDQFRGSFSRIPIQTAPKAPLNGSWDIDELSPTATATRDCGIESGNVILKDLDPKTTRLDIVIYYEYFWGYMQSRASHHFNTRLVNNRAILVPDIETRPRSYSIR